MLRGIWSGKTRKQNGHWQSGKKPAPIPVSNLYFKKLILEGSSNKIVEMSVTLPEDTPASSIRFGCYGKATFGAIYEPFTNVPYFGYYPKYMVNKTYTRSPSGYSGKVTAYYFTNSEDVIIEKGTTIYVQFKISWTAYNNIPIEEYLYIGLNEYCDVKDDTLVYVEG